MDAPNAHQSDLTLRKVAVPSQLLDFLQEVAVVMDASPKWCLGMLMRRVEHLVNTRPELFGFEFERARNRLDGRGKFVSDVQRVDVSKLHRSEKTKSGFVGVYTNGKGFTAMTQASADGQRKSISLGTFKTAEHAAEARRLYYLKHDMPYGRLWERLETFEGSPAWRGASPELKRRQAIWELAQEGTPAEGLSDEDRVWETTDPLSVKEPA